jgi:hypothetical protein
MDLGQQSNLGSLISAVLVGLLALASNQYARMDRTAMKSFLDGLQTRPHVIKSVRDSLEGPEQTGVKVVQDEIERLEAQLSGIFERWKTGKVSAGDPRLTKLWAAMHDLQAKLTENPQLLEQLPTRSRVDCIWSLFRAAEMNPQQFSEVFLKLSEKMSGHDDETVSAQAAVLRLYHGHDRNQPNEEMIAQKLEEFVRGNPDDMVGVFLFLIISRELYDNGHHEMAERLLRRGIQIYSGYPGHVGSSKLINELMDQKLHKRP